MIALALALAAPVTDVEPQELNAYVDCLYKGGANPGGLKSKLRAEERLRKCSRLRADAVKALPFYKARFQMIDANYRKSMLNAQD